MRHLAEQLRYLESSRLVLRRLDRGDTAALEELVRDGEVYRYLPGFLYERRYPDISKVIEGLYRECLDDSLILGIFENGGFCGLAEWYDYRPDTGCISVGNRLLSRCWGMGLAPATLEVMLCGLEERTDIRTVTATSMTANRASGRVLEKYGFLLIASGVEEDWGLTAPAIVDRWEILLKNGAGAAEGKIVNKDVQNQIRNLNI